MSEDIPTPDTALPGRWSHDSRSLLDAPYVIRNIIGPGELVVIYGAPKSGKTFLATDLASRVACGMPWFGHTVKKGFVIYIASEMGARVERRFHAWNRQHEALPDFIPIYIIPKVVNFLDEIGVERLFATIEQLKPDHAAPVLVVVDTLARSMSGGDENAAQDMGKVIAVTDRLRDAYNTATALIHHAGKDRGKGTRGSSALLGAVDCAIYVESSDGYHTAKVEWSRDGEAGMDYAFKLPVFELGQDSEGETVTTCVLEQTAQVAKPRTVTRVNVALDALREAVSANAVKLNGSSSIPKGVRACMQEHWKAQWLLRTGYEPGASADTAFWADKKKLLAAGTIQISKPYVWICLNG